MNERALLTGIAAPGPLRRHPHLSALVPEVTRWRRFGRADIVVGGRGDDAWGAGRSRAARRLIAEDGLIRSVGPASTGAPALSLLVGPAEGPHPLMRLLASGDWETPALLAEASDLLAFKRAEGLGRTNAALPAADLRALGRPRVLVADRAPDDGFLGAESPPDSAFDAMLQVARAETPHGFLIVVRFGCRGLSEAALAQADAVLTDVDIADLVGRVDVVHVLAGLAGLEAVLAGTPVVCHGSPFYAGLGLTDDRAAPRGRRISREILFAASYIAAPRYVDPLTGEPCAPRLTFERLAALKRHARRVAGDWAPVNVRAFKQGVVKAFLAGPCSRYPAPAGLASRLAVWATSADPPALGARSCTRIEDGFIRSVGLGSAFTPASSMVLDDAGIHFDPGRPSDLERLLNDTTFNPGLLRQAARLRRRLVESGLSKYNLPPTPPVLPQADGRPVVFVPGQVEDDAAVALAGRGMTNLELLERVRAARPEACIVYKEHPDVSAGNRVGRVRDTAARRLADHIVRHDDVLSWIAAADEVHTLTSLTGFEALLREKPVTTYGWPFYAGWGLTEDMTPWPGSARRTLTLDALVAGALILYPLYLDPLTALPCDALTFVERLVQAREAGSPQRPRGRVLRLIRAAKVMLNPPRPGPY